MGVCAAGVALLLGHVGTANAVQGMSAPALITSNALADCTTLAGDAISWSEDLNPQANTPNLVAAVVADDGINGPSHATELGPSTGTAGCPVLAGAGINVLAAADVPPATSDPVRLTTGTGGLWIGAPGAPATHLADDATRPAVSVAPDGSAVVAWLAAQNKSVTDPTYSLYAARRVATGPFGAPQAVAGPDEQDPGATQELGTPFIVAPVAAIDDQDESTVAWAPDEALTGTGSIVQADSAAANDPFGPPQDVFAPTGEGNGADLDQLLLAGNGSGQYLLTYADEALGGEGGIGLAERPDAGAAFAQAADPSGMSIPSDNSYPYVFGLGDDAQGNGYELLDPSRSGNLDEDLAVYRRAPNGTFGPAEYLQDQAHNQLQSVGSAALAVRPDGTAAVIWIRNSLGPGGALLSQVMLVTAPPGKPFGKPVALTGYGVVAQGATVGFDSQGRLRTAWTVSGYFGSGGGYLYSSIADPAASAPVTHAPLRISIAADPRQSSSDTVAFTVRDNQPCFVRVQAIIEGGGYADVNGHWVVNDGQADPTALAAVPGLTPFIPDSSAGYVPANHPVRSSITLTDDLANIENGSAPAKPYHVRLIAYASTTAPVSAVAATTVTLTPPAAPRH